MVDVFIVALAIVTLVSVSRWCRPVRPMTAFWLALLACAWIWANLRNSGWQDVWGEGDPEGLDPVTRAMFWRGWPLAPFMVCVIHGQRFRPTGPEGLVLVLDWAVLLLVLSLARFVCGPCFPGRGRRPPPACQVIGRMPQ